ncbi:hypothetical protein HG530_001087 [Fusarium avenaceum]|nr:hypothetical protein HG530_001087 [Fusarium avenaceum]
MTATFCPAVTAPPAMYPPTWPTVATALSGDAVLGDMYGSGYSFLYGPYATKISDETCRFMDGSRGMVTKERGHRDKPAIWNVTSYCLDIVFGVSVLVGFWVMNVNHSLVVEDHTPGISLFSRMFQNHCGFNLSPAQRLPAFGLLIRVGLRIRIVGSEGDGNHARRDEAGTTH